MDKIEFVEELLPVLIPIAAIELGLMICALVDCIRRQRTNGPKWLWILLIVLVNLIGPLVT